MKIDKIEMDAAPMPRADPRRCCCRLTSLSADLYRQDCG